MIGKILHSRLFQCKTIAEVHINNTSDDILDLNVVVVKKTKDNLEIESAKHCISSLEEFSAYLPKKIPLSLIIDGKGVIQKTVHENEQVPAINRVLPNVQTDEFVWTEQQLITGKTFIAITRKAFVEECIDKFSELGYFVIDVTVGPLVLDSIASLLPEETNEIRVKNYEIKYDSKGLHEIAKNGINEASYKILIGDDEMTNLDLIPFAGGVTFFKHSGSTASPLYTLFRPGKENYTFKKIYRFSALLLTGLLLSLLLGNYIIFLHYSNIYDYNQGEYNLNKELLDRLTWYEAEFLQQKNFLEDKASRGSPMFSYYADRLACLLPTEISFTELTLNPVTESVKTGKEIVCDQNRIVINGLAEKSILLNQYMKEIGNEPWVKDVNLNGYKSDANQAGEFSIEILLGNGNE